MDANALLQGLLRNLPLILKNLWPLFAILFAFLLFKLFLQRLVARILFNRQTGIDSIRKLDWQQFELMLGAFFRQEGWIASQTGLGGADGGVDLRLIRNGEHAVVQCKQWRTRTVGPEPVRALYGVMVARNAQRAFFVTSGRYTRAAREFARGKPMELIDGNQLGRFFVARRQSTTNHASMTKPKPLLTNPGGTPSCPKCGSPMVQKTARSGTRIGQSFLGCSTWPRCRGIVNIP